MMEYIGSAVEFHTDCVCSCIYHLKRIRRETGPLLRLEERQATAGGSFHRRKIACGISANQQQSAGCENARTLAKETRWRIESLHSGCTGNEIG